MKTFNELYEMKETYNKGIKGMENVNKVISLHRTGLKNGELSIFKFQSSDLDSLTKFIKENNITSTTISFNPMKDKFEAGVLINY